MAAGHPNYVAGRNANWVSESSKDAGGRNVCLAGRLFAVRKLGLVDGVFGTHGRCQNFSNHFSTRIFRRKRFDNRLRFEHINAGRQFPIHRTTKL